jgi:hypothetical protein
VVAGPLHEHGSLVGEDCDTTVASVENTHRIQAPYEEKRASAAGTVAQMMGYLIV